MRYLPALLVLAVLLVLIAYPIVAFWPDRWW